MRASVEDPQPLLPKATRGILLGVIAVLLVISIFLPNAAVRADPPNVRFLPPTAAYFLNITSDRLPGSDANTVGLGLIVLFFGLSVWEFGLVLVALTAWTLVSAEQHRWLWVIVMIGSIMVAIGPPTVVAGKLFLDASNVSTTLGIAWIPAFIGGLALVVWTARANRFIDRDWYQTNPELIT